MSRRPWRVALVARGMHPWHGRGGLERHVFDLVTHLAAARVALTVITPPPRRGTAPPETLRWEGTPPTFLFVPYRTFPLAGRRGTTIADRNSAYLWFGWRAGRRAASLVARGEVDLVHGLGASVLGYATAAGTARAAPLVFNPQGLEEFGATTSLVARLKRLAYRPLQGAVRRCARAADVVVATDDALVDVVRRHLAVVPTRIRTIPNGVDLAVCDRYGASPATTAPCPGPAPTRLLLSVGRIEANKGFHVLADALARLAAAAPPRWRWVLVGDGPFRRRLERQVARLGIATHVTLTGRVSDVELDRWYRAAHLFVHPTLYEGSSLVTLEAMARGCPVVATRAGGLPDKVQPGRTGWLVAPNRAEALAGALTEALATPVPRLTTMGQRGRALVESRFAWPVVAARTLAVYEELMAGREGRA